METLADLVVRHVEGWATTNSLLSFISLMLRHQLRTQALKGNMDCSLQIASATTDPMTEDANIVCITLQDSNRQGYQLLICKADLRPKLPIDNA